jgi:thiopeptide-type bacteriocin biosynthesis protein
MEQLLPFDFYLLRIPLLPYSRIIQLHERYKDDNELIGEIKTLFEDPLLQEAIYLASPELYAEMMKWLRNRNALHSPRQRKLALSLYKYLLRMSTRCTPYGLFAGCSIGYLHDGDTVLDPVSGQSWQKVARLDMNCLTELSNELIKRHEVSVGIKFYPNSSLYMVGDTWRYFEYQVKNARRHYYLSTFSDTPYIKKIIAAAGGGVDIPTLVQMLASEGIPEDDATAFVRTLIQNQILVSALHPTITGEDTLSSILTQLEENNISNELTAALEYIRRLLASQENGVGRHIAVRDAIKEHFPGIAAKDLIQVDLFFNARANYIRDHTIKNIISQVQQLAVLGYKPANPDLQDFKRKFYGKYEEREIPLMVALDSETGIGYGIVSGENSSFTPLIDDLVMPGSIKYTRTEWTPYKKMVLEKFIAAQQDNVYTISLDDHDLDKLRTGIKAPGLPATFFLMGSLIAASPRHLDNGDYNLVLKACGGPSALTLLGRFAAGSAPLEAALKECTRHEQEMYRDKIIAEIVHLPEGRTGNVLLRPQLYDYEIPFLGNAAVPEIFRIPVSDLYVAVRNGHVILRSKRLNKEIVPRLTSAHDFTRGLPVYKFLCDLQSQHHTWAIQWDWDFLLEQPFLPRVTYRRLTLMRARWFITKTEFDTLTDTQEASGRIEALRKKYRLPDKVVLSEGDNELLIDFTCRFAHQLLTDRLRKNDVILYEYLFDADTQLVSGPEGVYTNEIIIPVRNAGYRPDKPVAPVKQHTTDIKRSFPPGSEWCYAKIYCGTKWVDRLLVKVLLPLIGSMTEERIIQQWFFIRYQDPDTHIRIRFYNSEDARFSHLITQRFNDAFSWYLENDIIRKIQYDTYVREIERYNEHTIALSEEFFFHDSNAVTQLLQLAHTGNAEYQRWLFAVKGVDSMLDDFGYTLAEKLAFLTKEQALYFHEFNGDAALTVQLNDKFRDQSKAIASVLETSLDALPVPATAMDIFNRRSAAGKQIYRRIMHLVKQQQVGTDILDQLLPSYIHMFLNRIFVANHRVHELVIHHYLMKYYASIIARQKARTIAGSYLNKDII